MEEEGISSLDLRFLARELRYESGIIRKIYQYGNRVKEFLFEIYSPGEGASWLYVDGSRAFLAREKKPAPQEPPSFCMFLRKHLLGKKIRNIRQHAFDRILELITDECILVFELLHPGNAVLCDSGMNIIMPLEIQKFRDRTVRPKYPYRYPPRQANPFELSFDDFSYHMKKSGKTTAAFLAVSMGLGSLYAKEVCFRAGLEGGGEASELAQRDALKLYEAMVSLDRENARACVYSDAATPFPLQMRREKPEEYETFSQALDGFFSRGAESLKEKSLEEERGRIGRIMESQEEAREKWEGIERDSRESAESIYNHFTTAQAALDGVRKARESGMGWEEIKERVENEESPEAESIKEIRENDGIIVLELGGKELELDIRKSVEENAAKYYEESKWARRKMSGTEEALKEQEKRREEAEEVETGEPEDMGWGEIEPEALKDVPKEKPRRKRRRWYEKFKWFTSSDGFLIAGGRSADQNETLIKKHTEPGDLVFHADIKGAAFVVIKSENKDISDEARKEAAEFAAANSKAWNRGLGAVDIFSVNPDQVSKSTISGYSLPKGSFMVRGEKTWYRDMEVKISVGVKLEGDEGVTVSGPVMAVRKNSDYFVTIKPGFKKSGELSRDIKNAILIKAGPDDRGWIERMALEDFEKMIPAGMGDIVEYGG